MSDTEKQLRWPASDDRLSNDAMAYIDAEQVLMDDRQEREEQALKAQPNDTEEG